jgi:hypothetical protein
MFGEISSAMKNIVETSDIMKRIRRMKGRIRTGRCR